MSLAAAFFGFQVLGLVNVEFDDVSYLFQIQVPY
jgi:hypothetical protein